MMGFDAMAHDASVPSNPKDIAKKKRINRSAKLKRCKLDARREQWLSQVKNKGGCKVMGMSASPPLPIPLPKSGQVQIREHERVGSGLHDSDLESPAHSPCSSVSCNPHKEIFNGGGSSISSICSTGYCFHSASDMEDGSEDNGPLDDWEAVADALSAYKDNDHEWRHFDPTVISGIEPQPMAMLKCPDEAGRASDRESSKPEPVQPALRAWRPDDIFRPQSLPNLSKQLIFPVNIKQHRMTMGAWTQHGVLSVPSSCPICYEDLDSTDTSFLPCLCGFRLCLFCHKRILEDDGRCPGCRKQYALVPAAGADVGIGGSRVLPLPVRLSHSCSIKD